MVVLTVILSSENNMIKAGLCSAHNSNNCIKCFSLRQPAYIVKCLMHISHFVTQNIKKIFLSGTWLFFPLQLCDSEDTIITGLICYSILICAKSTSSSTQHCFCIITVNVNSAKKKQILSSQPKGRSNLDVHDRWMNKQHVLYTYNGIQFSLKKKERNPVTCYKMGEPWERHAKWNMSVTKDKHYIIPLIRNMKNKQIHRIRK